MGVFLGAVVFVISERKQWLKFVCALKFMYGYLKTWGLTHGLALIDIAPFRNRFRELRLLFESQNQMWEKRMHICQKEQTLIYIP